MSEATTGGRGVPQEKMFLKTSEISQKTPVLEAFTSVV